MSIHECGMRSWWYPADLLERAELTERHVRLGWISRNEAHHVMERPDTGRQIILTRQTSVIERDPEKAVADG